VIANMSDRDRKMLLAIIPIVLVVAYYFLLLAPQRKEATASAQDLSKQTQRLNAAQSSLAQAKSSKNTFAADYTEMVRLGKAIPSATDMPSLIVQLDQAAHGTGIKFTHIATGDASGTGTAPPPAAPAGGGSGGTSGTNTGAGSDASSSSSSSSSSSGSAVGGQNSSGSNGQGASAGGGAKASTGLGQATESAHNASTTSDQANNKTDQASGGGSNGNTGTSSTPAAGGSTTGAAAPAGLTTVPLDLEFDGNFFNLANFFHRVKRMVHLNNQNVVVSGRLITIESIQYESDPTIFPKLKATLKATVYLSPASEGTTAGATPQGPSSTTTPASNSGGSAPAPAPAATSTLGAHSR
jgi:hypothetical protein